MEYSEAEKAFAVPPRFARSFDPYSADQKGYIAFHVE
jgi:hypothetical protein